ncbi:Chaperone protein DnaJ [Escovopsis weberi]|uniref:Chaperone protein DnaJ n=1 Tax=Escovopsis weberi TaxID=150374 RepID=A0A0M8N5A5_ESCWE|nr:Chaperone protein DnaJ [Escovopsis weberi]
MPPRIPCSTAPAFAIAAPLPSRVPPAFFLLRGQQHRPQHPPQPPPQHQYLHQSRNPAGQPWLRSRAFHAGARLLRRSGHLESKDHYQRLNLEPSATPGDIKKSFYSLSKVHHPDANPSDPDAASTFSLLSESYTVLSDPARRAAYDRDVLRLQHHPHPHGPHHHGSYHSTSAAGANPAGGRAPSGLSRRRGTFRGPPPSFFRSGGYGAHAERRRKAHEETAGTQTSGDTTSGAGADFSSNSNPNSNSDPSSNSDFSSRSGMGPGADPFHYHYHFHFHRQGADVPPYFDKEGHTRTHQREDARRWRRARTALGDDGLEFEPQTSLVGHFFIVAGILAATFLAPVVYLQFMRLGTRKREDD